MLSKRYFAILLLETLGIFGILFYIPSIPWWAHFLLFLMLVFGFFCILQKGSIRFLPRKEKTVIFLIAVSFLLSALVYSECFVHLKIEKGEPYTDGRMHEIAATVKEVKRQTVGGSSYRMTVSAVDGDKKTFSILTDIPYYGALAVGDDIRFSSKIEAVTGETKQYSRSDGVFYTATCQDVTILKKNGNPEPPIVKIKKAIQKQFDTYMGEEAAAYGKTLITGDRTELSGPLKLAYRRLGISHLLAVSGLHLAVIIGGLDFVFTKLTVSRRKKNYILLICIFLFAAVCAFTMSVIRAGLMLAIFYLLDCIGEERDPVTSLFLAVLLIVLVNPYSIFDVGLILSFLATLGILTTAPQKRRGDAMPEPKKPFFIRGLSAIWNLCKVTFAATAFTLPVTFFGYGTFSLLAPVANLIFVPLTEIILYFLLMFTVFSFIPFMGVAMGFVAEKLIFVSSELSFVLSDMRNIYISTSYPFAKYILLFFILCLVAIFLMKKKRLPILFASFMLCAVTFGVFRVVQTVGRERELYMASDGKSDVVTVLDEGQTLLADITTGGRTVPNMAVENLTACNEQEIDTYLITHLHADHAGILHSLLSEIKIHTVYVPMPRNEKEIRYTEDIEKAAGRYTDIRYYTGDGTETLTVGKTKIHLPAQLFLPRSKHPVTVIYADREGLPDFAYLGASATELDAVTICMKDYKTLIIGCHGPQEKEKIPYATFRYAEKIAVTDSETLSYMDNLLLTDDRLQTDKSIPIS